MTTNFPPNFLQLIHQMETLEFTGLCLITILLFFSDSGIAYGQCKEDQSSALLGLKQSLKFEADFLTKLATWNSRTDCCTWSGVTCKNGDVIALDLSLEGIHGGLNNSSSLFELRHLSDLNLAVNSFSSSIPAAFGKLVNLVHLNLSNSGFFGQIPIEISHLTRLLTLDMSSVGISGELKLEHPNLTVLVQGLSRLEELHLDGVNISYKGNEWSSALSRSLPNLRVLSLSNCYLSGPPDSSLAGLNSLSVIKLGMNNISAPLPEFFSDFSSLTVLGLSYCGLSGTFPEKILQILTLKRLDASGNPLLEGTLPEFPRSSSLQELVLSGTKFSGNLPHSLGNLHRQVKLDLSSCNFSGPIPRSVGDLTEVEFLDLSHNMLTGSIPSFRSMKNLREISLRNNVLTGMIPASLFALPSLHKVELSFNQFSGPLDVFPNASSSPLLSLDLKSNKLEGSLPMSLFELQNLRVLDLSFNNLRGTVEPEAIWKLKNLTSLDLSYNKLSFDMENSSSIWLPADLAQLRLASCSLNQFPKLRNNSRLFHLDLSNNQIQGEIPSWIWTLSHVNLSFNLLVNLQPPSPDQDFKYGNVLDLHSNMLKGPLLLLPNAVYLDYSNNSFSTKIPFDIANYLEVAVFFSVSRNQLSGRIPESICNASTLQALDLSYNDLNGTIPSCLFKLSSSLVVLNLGGNKLKGHIPGNIPIDCALKTFDLNDNLFEGQLPTNLSRCIGLEVLNLGNNQISGNFPCWLTRLANLKVLVLRFNKFDGPFSCPGTKNLWQMLQILDLASNNFTGKLPSEYFSSWKAMATARNETRSADSPLGFDVLKFSRVGYQDRVAVVSKGLQLELVKILTVYTSLDLSINMFYGNIPDEIGNLTSLYALNLSNNALTGQIPTSLGNLKNMESLDLSQNMLNGSIPSSLASLSFLSYLNLSFNRLEGMIPKGRQFQTFPGAAFQGNEGLCGNPLKVSCRFEVSPDSSPPSEAKSGSKIEWRLICAQIGFTVGFGVIILPLVFCKRWRLYYYDQVDEAILKILEKAGCSRRTINRIRRQMM